MARIFEGRVFESFYDRNSGRTFSDLEFRRCRFESCAISITRKPHRRSTVRNVRIIDCTEVGCVLDTAIVEDVEVNGLKTNGTFHTWGAVFSHVTLRGRVGDIMISPTVSPGQASAAEQRAFDAAHVTYYEAVDWALDIREAEFDDVDLRGIPGHLVRRDPETQALITRAKALQGKWRQFDLSKTYWPTAIDLFLDGPWDSTVLVAPKHDRSYQVLLDGLRLLRDEGIAELG